MHVEQVMFRSGAVRCAGDLHLPDGVGDRAPAPAVVMGHSVVMVKEALGPHAGHLVRAGVSYLRGRPEVDPERIGLWGHSTAAGVTIVAGALDRRIKCVAGQNPSLLDACAGEDPRPPPAGRGPRLLEQDFERCFETGEGATVPALAADDPKLAGYVAQSDEFGLSIEPGLGRSMGLAAEFFDQHLRRAPLFRPSPTPEEARARGLRPEYRLVAGAREAS